MSTASRALSAERWRCLTVGCNPKLNGHTAPQHAGQTGHRVAKWPVRSAAGERKQRARNRSNPWHPVDPRGPVANGDPEGMAEWEESR